MSNKKEKKKPSAIYFVYFLAISIFLFLIVLEQKSSSSEISLTEAYTKLEEGEVSKVIITEESGELFLTKEAISSPKYKKGNKALFSEDKPAFTFLIGTKQEFEKSFNEKTKKNNKKTTLEFDSDKYESLIGMLVNIFSMLLIFGLFYYFMFRRMGGGSGGSRGPGQIFNIGKSKAKLFDKDSKVKVSFKDVAGLEGAKEEVEEIVEFLKNPDKFTKLGGKIPKGALLVGPPGTGKTLLAKAVAGEADVPFYSLSGSDFVEMFVGVGASRVRDLFAKAKEQSPSIIFIDEIDAIGRARGKNNMSGSNDERENTLNQLLTEMDGFGTETNVIVVAATNRADVLDKALLRPGRFDRTIYVDLPELNERKEIFEVHLKKLTLKEDLDIDFLAKQTPGFSGADIANICNEAALVAARKSKESVERQDFLDAIDRIVGGLEKKNKIIKPEEKRRIAYHEAGHALVSWMTKYANPLVKVTIVPRGRSLGAAWYLPEERQITTTEQMFDEMCATLGGRAAEKVIFGNISTGALSDLEKVTKQAQAMVSIYGLNDKIGNISYYDSSGQGGYEFNKPYSEQTAQLIDEEISNFIEIQYDRAIRIIEENKTKLDALAEKLLEKEVIFKDDLVAVLGERITDEPTKIAQEINKEEE